MRSILFLLISAVFICNTAMANEPDSAYIRAFTTDKNNSRNGLHLAWSIDRTHWHTIGDEYSFLRCDYGSWGTEKRMLNPVLLRDESGTWHCLWDVNERDGVFAHAASSDLINWKPQSYRPKEEEQAFIASLGLQENDTENIFRVKWSVIDGLAKAQQLSAYTKLLWNEQAKDDAVRFAGLKTVEAAITVRPQEAKKISDQLIGVFFEDINYAADGGLYAELVQNRDFEYSPDEKEGRDNTWNPAKAWTVNGDREWTIDTVAPIHPNNKHYAVLENTGLINEGFDGFALQAGEKYDFSVFARTLTGKTGKLHVRLTGKNGEVFGEAIIKSISSQWKKYAAILTADKTVADARLEIIPQATGKTALDMISLFPQKTFKGRKNGLRADLAQTIADLKPRFVRFPGGCVAHGDALETIYRWKNTVGALESRKPQRNLWFYHQTVGLGYYEYFQFCEDIGAEPLPVVAAGVPCQNSAHHGHRLAGQQGGIPMDKMDDYVQDILDLIEWANGDKSTVWGRKRAEAGHPAPFNLKYIGVGNEDLITGVFEERFTMIYNAIKAKHPEITVIGTVGPFFEGADYREGWDFATRLGVPVVDEHYYQSPAWFIYNQDFYDRYDRSKSKVYLGEYAAHLPGRPNNLETALAEALYLTAVERNGDVVSMTSYAPLLAKEGNTQWNPDLIYFNNTEVKPTVGYYVQKLYGENAGDEYLPSAVSLNNMQDAVKKRIACSVVRDNKSGDVIVKLVNMLPVSVKANVELPLPENQTVTASKTVLTGDPSNKQARPVTDTIEISKQFLYELPAYSFTVIRVEKYNILN
jgi:alpha-L-arabinofuranosidase